MSLSLARRTCTATAGVSARPLCATLLVTVVMTACKAFPDAKLQPITLPDMARSDESVQVQVREEYAAVMAKQNRRAPAKDLGAAYGHLGMLFQAAEYFDAAEPALVNAQALAPDDSRWPYYLGHLYRRTGDTTRSITSFTRALALRPGDVPTLVWLARTYLDEGRAADAEPLLLRAQAAAPRDGAVLAARGQAALSRGEYAQAARLLEEALSVNPRAASVHAPLAAAYRAQGETAKADSHLKQWVNGEIPLNDPLSDQLALSLRSAISYETRGVRALDAGNWSDAAARFREGLALTTRETPVGRSLTHKLGLALYLGGDLHGAMRQFDEAIRLAPAAGHDEPASRAHYSLGLIMASADRGADAIEHLSRAVAYDATSLQNRLALADALRRDGRFADALPHYAEAVRLEPQAADARFGYAMALIRLRRYVEARNWLEEAVQAQPDRVELKHALARLLAAAPDPRARDGRRAYALGEEILRTNKRTEVGETIAMALAELGEYQMAAAIQRGVMQAADKAGLREEVARMAVNLRKYEQRQPCRAPWPDNDPIHRPGPPVSPQLARLISGR